MSYLQALALIPGSVKALTLQGVGVNHPHMVSDGLSDRAGAEMAGF